MSHASHVPSAPSPTSRARTYLVLALGDAAGDLGIVRPLGTVEAAGRGAARALARLLYGDVPDGCLRVQAAGGAPADLVARALALDWAV